MTNFTELRGREIHLSYVSRALLEAALDGLRGKHPIAVLVMPAMLRVGVTVVDTPQDGAEFGSGDEVALLDEFFRIPGSPSSKPYRAVWETRAEDYWRDRQYPGRSLQRMRTDKVKAGRGFFQAKQASGKDRWGLKRDCGSQLMEPGFEPVRLIDLAIWYGRDIEINNLDELLHSFLATFPMDQDNLVSTLYDSSIPGYYSDLALSPLPITRDDLAEVTGAMKSAPLIDGTLREVISRLEAGVDSEGFVQTPGLVARIIEAWMRGDMVILVGQPGTGKTLLANSIAKSLQLIVGDLQVVWVPVRADFDESDLLGYEQLDGRPYLRDFATTVLMSESPLSPHMVVLDEFNLVVPENYLSAILSAAEDVERRVALPGSSVARLPVDTFILATCNSYIDEPETRSRLSFPSKRRAAIIKMPNVLADNYEIHGREAIKNLSLRMIEQEKNLLRDRYKDGQASAFDALRSAALSASDGRSAISETTWESLYQISAVILGTPEGRDFYTMGLLKDIVMAISYCSGDSGQEAIALGQLVADKIIHQLRGPKVRADQLLSAVTDLPNLNEIARLLDMMKAGPGEELIHLV